MKLRYSPRALGDLAAISIQSPSPWTAATGSPAAGFRFAAAQRQTASPRRMVAMHLAALKYHENPCL
jgi:hypothetical protein